MDDVDVMRLEALDLVPLYQAPAAPVEEEPTGPPPEPGAILKVQCGGFTVWCDGFRTTGEYTASLVFLSMFGTQTAVRAVWATLAGKKRNTSIDIGGEHVKLDEQARYSTMRSLLSPQCVHIVLVHPFATSMVSPFSLSYYLLSDTPEEQFWPRFNRMCQVPMRHSWRQAIWELGLKLKMIRPMFGIGLPGYVVDVDSEEWTKAVTAAVKAGELK